MPPHQHSHHAHAHAHGETEGGGRRLILSIGLNLVITVAEVIGGLLSGSLALLSDALHNFSDTASLGISYAARRISGREANRRKTFGYKRAEVVGAFVNLVTLVLIALYLIKEAVERFLDPQPIEGRVMLIVALIGLAANVLTALLLYRESKGSLNIRSAFLHIISDAVSSVGVVIGGLLILYYDVYFVDPLLTLLISLYILYHSYHLLRQTIDILMEGTPRGLDLDEIVRDVQGVDGVLDMHHIHVWQLDENHTALEAHVMIDKEDMGRLEEIKRAIKAALADRYDIAHSTLEFEFVPCHGAADPDCFEKAIVPEH
jgi:cobalt-zinc-cadmium efflux system protein